MTDREMLEKCIDQFRLLKRLSDSVGQIKTDGKKTTKRKAITFECDAAIEGIFDHLAAEYPR